MDARRSSLTALVLALSALRETIDGMDAQARDLATRYRHTEDLYVLGYGATYGAALTVAPPCDALQKNSTAFFALPRGDYALAPILSVVFMQLFSYHLAVAKGHSPDYPRNGSKTITVD